MSFFKLNINIDARMRLEIAKQWLIENPEETMITDLKIFKIPPTTLRNSKSRLDGGVLYMEFSYPNFEVRPGIGLARLAGLARTF